MKFLVDAMTDETLPTKTQDTATPSVQEEEVAERCVQRSERAVLNAQSALPSMLKRS